MLFCRKGAANKKGNKKPKKGATDVVVCRLRAASKIVGGIKFVKASMSDVAKKFITWSAQTDDGVGTVYEKAAKLHLDKVKETDLMIHDVGDEISAVKLMYTVIDRWNLMLLVSVGSDAVDASLFRREDGKTEEDLKGNPDNARDELVSCLENDTYLKESAPHLKLFLDINVAKLEACETADSVNEAKTELETALAAAKTLIGTLRRGMKDLLCPLSWNQWSDHEDAESNEISAVGSILTLTTSYIISFVCPASRFRP